MRVPRVSETRGTRDIIAKFQLSLQNFLRRVDPFQREHLREPAHQRLRVRPAQLLLPLASHPVLGPHAVPVRLQPRGDPLLVVKRTPKRIRRVHADVSPERVALVLTLANGVRFRLELGDGNGESPGRRGWLAPDERLPAAFNSGCNLGVHSLDLRAAPLKMSLSVNVDGPALLGEVTALPLVVVSTGDGLDDATLVLTVKEGDKAYLGSTRENGGIRSEEASAPGPDVVLLRAPDSQSAMQPREPIAIGNVPPGGTWRGKVYVLWRRLGPPVTLATELRGVHSGLPAESGGEANAALETVAELSAIAPFTATHRGLSAYRTFALVLDEPASAGTVEHATDGDVTASTVSVAAAGSILAVDSVGFAAVGFKGDEGAMARNEPNGGVELGEGDEFLQLWPRRREASAGTRA